ncbi:MAG: endolytic transglycosylase MltG [Clostridiales bacterium]|nr:endolytic transglycosylase MltG [Clostridiales bacterium]MCF8021124.1 endolytic transglycosylase MltG [Clostridiales bacterium]
MAENNYKQKPRTAKNKGLFKLYALAAVVFILLAGTAYVYFYSVFSAVQPGVEKRVKVTVPEGSDSHHIASILKDKGLIKNKTVFVYYSKFTGSASRLKAGEYDLSPSRSLPAIIDSLVAGTREKTIKYTIPEGYTLEQIGKLLEKKGLVELDKFKKAANRGDFDYPFLEDITEGPGRMEGYLFPDTYQVTNSYSEKEIINIMLERFQEVTEKMNFSRRSQNIDLSFREAVTIASMVEEEAKVDPERPVIAGVILNRLYKGQLLQIDATVQYALGEHHAKLYNKDLKVDSPYNTYKYPGLPPGPISSPGKNSLQAVLEAQKTNYLYYVARPDGTHAFAETLHQHNVNINKYQ